MVVQSIPPIINTNAFGVPQIPPLLLLNWSYFLKKIYFCKFFFSETYWLPTALLMRAIKVRNSSA